MVEHALGILHWQEELVGDDIPPRWMWHLDHELERWFDEVNERRDSGAGGDPHDPRERDTTAPMMVNTLHPRNRR